MCSCDGKAGFLALHKSVSRVHVWMFMLITGTVRALCHGAIQASIMTLSLSVMMMAALRSLDSQ